MGYGYYTTRGADGEMRPTGYMVIATCDKRGCDNRIDRGLGHLCGTEPHDPSSDEPGCGRYYCAEHLGWVGPRGGCPHPNRYHVGQGRVISDMVPNADGSIVCLDPVGHDGQHAWAVGVPV
jgi:hypothetical protein